MALIMIADDTPEIVMLLEDFLKARGHQVVSVTDGVQMVEKAKDWKPHLIISDIMMPGAYGSSAYKSLQAEQATAGIPVIFLTAVTPEKARKIVTEGPKTRILFKPLETDALLKLVDELLIASK